MSTIERGENKPPIAVLVDDSRTIVELVKVYLTGFGFEYYTTTNPYDALTLVQAHKPLLLISDVNMPEMTGIELAEKIRRERDLCGVGILLLSRNKESYLNVEHHADGFITKPIQGEELVAQVKRIIQKRSIYR